MRFGVSVDETEDATPDQKAADGRYLTWIGIDADTKLVVSYLVAAEIPTGDGLHG